MCSIGRQTHVHSCFTICWAAQAAVYHFHGVPKRLLPRKAFGVFRHRNLVPLSPYLRGFSDNFCIPVSRWTEVRREDIPSDSGMYILADSEEAWPLPVARSSSQIAAYVQSR